MAEVRRKWGDEETAADKVKERRLEWLGHLARMPPSSAGGLNPALGVVQKKR